MSALASWFDSIVGSEEEREVADALIAVIEAAQRVDRALDHPAALVAVIGCRAELQVALAMVQRLLKEAS